MVEGRAHTVAAAVDELADYLVGEDPLRIEDHWQWLTKAASTGAGRCSPAPSPGSTWRCGTSRARRWTCRSTSCSAGTSASTAGSAATNRRTWPSRRRSARQRGSPRLGLQTRAGQGDRGRAAGPLARRGYLGGAADRGHGRGLRRLGRTALSAWADRPGGRPATRLRDAEPADRGGARASTPTAARTCWTTSSTGRYSATRTATSSAGPGHRGRREGGRARGGGRAPLAQPRLAPRRVADRVVRSSGNPMRR